MALPAGSTAVRVVTCCCPAFARGVDLPRAETSCKAEFLPVGSFRLPGFCPVLDLLLGFSLYYYRPIHLNFEILVGFLVVIGEMDSQ